MKSAALALAILAASLAPACRATDADAFAGVVETGCARCRFAADEPGCDLAIRVDGRTLLVEGTGIDDHGDAHAADGFCNATRRARVSGHVAGDRFVADSFELLPDARADSD